MSDVVERKIGNVKVIIDRAGCIGSANCVKVSPELFEMDAESIVVFKDDAGELDPDVVLEACQVCPVDALSVEDASGNQIIP